MPANVPQHGFVYNQVVIVYVVMPGNQTVPVSYGTLVTELDLASAFFVLP